MLRTHSKIMCILQTEFRLPTFVAQVSGSVMLGAFIRYQYMYIMLQF